MTRATSCRRHDPYLPLRGKAVGAGRLESPMKLPPEGLSSDELEAWWNSAQPKAAVRKIREKKQYKPRTEWVSAAVVDSDGYCRRSRGKIDFGRFHGPKVQGWT